VEKLARYVDKEEKIWVKLIVSAPLLERISQVASTGVLPEGCELRQVKFLNNLVEQDHRFLKRLVKPGLGFFSPETAWRTLQGYEIMHMICPVPGSLNMTLFMSLPMGAVHF